MALTENKSKKPKVKVFTKKEKQKKPDEKTIIQKLQEKYESVINNTV